MAAYKWVSKNELNSIVMRLQKTTTATQASTAAFDNQDCHVAYIRKRDPTALRFRRRLGSSNSSASRSSVGSSLEEITGRVTRPTTASHAARHDFDAQSCHIDYLKKTVPDYPKPRVTRSVSIQEEIAIGEKLFRETTASKAARHDFDAQAAHIDYLVRTLPEYPKSRVTRNVTVQEEIAIGEKLTKETRASNAARHDFDHQLAHVRYLEKVDPKYPGNKKYGFRNKSAPFRSIGTEEELERLNERLTKPTVSSLGGKPIEHKDFNYIKPPFSKPCPPIKGLDTKFKGTAKMSEDRMQESISRLYKQHSRYR